METRITLQPAYVLHRRPYQNSSLLIDFFTLDYGLIRAVAKGARREKSRHRALLQLFQPLLVSLAGRGEVKTVSAVESGLAPITLRGERLYSGLYINELLTRLLMAQEEHTQLYKAYQQALLNLQAEHSLQPLLRRFELQLLHELGYGINLQHDCQTNERITAEARYQFIVDIGFHKVDASDEERETYPGEHLIALRDLQLDDAAVARSAKRLLRRALGAHLGDKPLVSRNLFRGRQ